MYEFTPPGHWPKLREVIFCFQMMGCRLEESPNIVGGSGNHPSIMRFLIHPDTGATALIGLLKDDESISPDEIAGWERDLDIEIPKPPAWCDD